MLPVLNAIRRITARVTTLHRGLAAGLANTIRRTSRHTDLAEYSSILAPVRSSGRDTACGSVAKKFQPYPVLVDYGSYYGERRCPQSVEPSVWAEPLLLGRVAAFADDSYDFRQLS